MGVPSSAPGRCSPVPSGDFGVAAGRTALTLHTLWCTGMGSGTQTQIFWGCQKAAGCPDPRDPIPWTPSLIGTPGDGCAKSPAGGPRQRQRGPGIRPGWLRELFDGDGGVCGVCRVWGGLPQIPGNPSRNGEPGHAAVPGLPWEGARGRLSRGRLRSQALAGPARLVPLET